jgi:hypothetical protein
VVRLHHPRESVRYGPSRTSDGFSEQARCAILTLRKRRDAVLAAQGGDKMAGDIRASRIRYGALAALAAVALSAAPAKAASWLEMNFWLSGPRYDANPPPCDNGFALGTIQRKFAEKEGRFWNSSLQIVGFEGIQETGFQSWKSESIPRRFCSAKAVVSDGVKRPVHYWIGEDTAFAGSVFGVEWCVVGLDRNWAYNPSCKMARP